MWALGTEPGFYAKVLSALNYQAIAPTPRNNYMLNTGHKTVHTYGLNIQLER